MHRHGPPQQAGADGDAADDRLDHGPAGHQPRVDQHLAPAPGPGHRQHDERGEQRHHEGEQPVAELDGLMQHRHLGHADRGEAAGEALRPGGAAETGGGDAHDRAGHRDAGLGGDHPGGDQQLAALGHQR